MNNKVFKIFLGSVMKGEHDHWNFKTTLDNNSESIFLIFTEFKCNLFCSHSGLELCLLKMNRRLFINFSKRCEIQFEVTCIIVSQIHELNVKNEKEKLNSFSI